MLGGDEQKDGTAGQRKKKPGRKTKKEDTMEQDVGQYEFQQKT